MFLEEKVAARLSRIIPGPFRSRSVFEISKGNKGEVELGFSLQFPVLTLVPKLSNSKLKTAFLLQWRSSSKLEKMQLKQ